MRKPLQQCLRGGQGRLRQKRADFGMKRAGLPRRGQRTGPKAGQQLCGLGGFGPVFAVQQIGQRGDGAHMRGVAHFDPP